MKPYTVSKDSKKIKISKFYIIVTAAVMLSAAVSLYTSAVEMKALHNEKEELQALIDEETQIHVELQNQKHYFESDSYLEKVAREKLGLVKSNDVIFRDINSSN